MKLLRHVSFVDCPGHEALMATMLSGAAIMDGALLLIAANETCPKPQTVEHLGAIEIMQLKNIIIIQNKVDLVCRSVAVNQHDIIQKFIENTIADGAPLIPVSAQQKFNIDVVCEYLVNKIPVPKRDFISPANMMIVRSFDVNKPGCEFQQLKGGIVGGSILKGVLRVGQMVEIRPGLFCKDNKGGIKCVPIYTRVVSLFAEKNNLQYAIPGGLIGVGSTMDPTLARADRLVGQILGEVGSLPDVFSELEVNVFLLRTLLGVQKSEAEKAPKVSKLAKGENLKLHIGSMTRDCKVSAVKNDMAKLKLSYPACAARGEKVALSRQINGQWRLIGRGQVQAGKKIEIPPWSADDC